MPRRVHPAQRLYRFGRKIRVGLNRTAYAIIVRLSAESQRPRDDIVRAIIRDYLANPLPYRGSIANHKRPCFLHLRINDAVVDRFAEKAFDCDCYGYGRFLGSIVERYFARFSYEQLLNVFSAYADVLVPILKETSNGQDFETG